MFKKIVNAIAEIHTKDDFNAACGMIDSAFQHEKINWNDHELLYELVSKLAPLYQD